MGGDYCFDEDVKNEQEPPFPDHAEITYLGSSLLKAVDELPGAVHLAVGHYRYQWDQPTPLNRISCLESLRIFIHPERAVDWYEVAKILGGNPGLRDLYVRVLRDRDYRDLNDRSSDRSLETIGSSAKALYSLTLEGTFTLGRVSLTWISSLPQLRSLSLVGLKLTLGMAKCLHGQLPALRILKLAEAYQQSRISPLNTKQTSTLGAFLSTLRLGYLSIRGFEPGIVLRNVRYSGSSLYSLRLHVPQRFTSEEAMPMFTVQQVREIASACPNLECLTFDVSHTDLLSWARAQTEEPSEVMPDRWMDDISTFRDSPPTDSPIFSALLTMSALKHIRCFVQFGMNPAEKYEDIQRDFCISEVVATYLYLRKHKRGCELQTLVICRRKNGPYQRWDISEIGVERVVVTAHRNWTWVRYTLDLEKGMVVNSERGGDQGEELRGRAEVLRAEELEWRAEFERREPSNREDYLDHFHRPIYDEDWKPMWAVTKGW